MGYLWLIANSRVMHSLVGNRERSRYDMDIGLIDADWALGNLAQ